MVFRNIFVGSALLWLSSSPFLFDGASALIGNASSYFNVQIPTSLHNTGGMQHHVAHFGTFWYDLVHGDTSLLREVQNTQGNLCDYPHENITKEWGPPPFFLLARYDNACPIVSRVRKAQSLGASGVIFVNEKCLCNEPNCTTNMGAANTLGNDCEQDLPILSDDGSGKSVSIPSMVIERSLGLAIRDKLANKEPVVAEMAWHWPRMEETVIVDLWHTPNDIATQEFLTNFSQVALAMEEKMLFRPHYYLLDGTHLQCLGRVDKPEDSCYQLCTNNGRYCAPSHQGVTGKHIVEESLRRMCIWQHYAGKPYWLYIDHFSEWCQSSDFFANEACLKDAFKHSEIDETKIEECMKDSGDPAADQENHLLQLAVAESAKVVYTPTMYINQVPFTWTLTTRYVFEVLCRGFATGKAPHVCYVCQECGDPAACASRHPMVCHADDGHEQEEPKKKKKRKGRFFKVMLFLGLIGGAGYFYYKKFMADGDGLGTYSLSDALMSDTA